MSADIIRFAPKIDKRSELHEIRQGVRDSLKSFGVETEEGLELKYDAIAVSTNALSETPAKLASRRTRAIVDALWPVQNGCLRSLLAMTPP